MPAAPHADGRAPPPPPRAPPRPRAPQPNNLIPKDVTRVAELIQATACDGAGVVVAVLDTGVDPAAAGLRRTTSGAPKVIDILDCTGSGDVDTSTVAVLPAAASSLTGLTGRTLRLTRAIRDACPDATFHLGVKAAYHLFPNSLVARLRKERRSRWDKANRAALNRVRKRLSELKDAAAAAAPNAPDSPPHNLLVEEFEARQTVLLAAEKNYNDLGPLYDCLVFHDGTRWRAVVDTTERGALDQCVVLEDYHVRCRYAEFGAGVMMHFGVNVYDRGNLLSIVVDGGSHGTHVAGIVAANYPDAPHLNGLAPGAQIVSLKIGDSRLSSMETHQGTTRALAYLLNHTQAPESPATDSPATRPTPPQVNHPHPLPSKPPQPSPESNASELESDSPSASASASASACPPGGEVPQTSSTDNVPAGRPASVKPESRRIKIDVVNMSFGEHTRDPDKGRFVALVNKLVHNHNVLFLSSAGNDGPALSSVSAPGGTTDSLIGVGAYVTPEMLTQAYSLLHSEFGSRHPPTPPALPGTSTPVRHHPPDKGTLHQFGNDANAVAGVPYTWSSRGPVSNGALGVSICAPGGAIAPVPLWMLRKKMLMNGTSMSSPSAAGAVAVIVSFLKKNRLPYTSALIRRAIENTARPLQPPGLGPSLGEKSKLASASGKGESSDAYESDYYQDLVFACGRGSIDASAACEYLQQYAAARDASRNLNSSTEAGRTASLSDKPCGGGGGSGGEHSGAKSETCTDGGRETHSSPGSDQDPVSLEEWRISIRVEDGSPARRGSNSTGFGPMNTTHGIFLRGTAETRSKQRASVAIEASPRAEDCPQTKRAIASIEATIILECKASWVEVPSSLVLLGGGRQFPVFVDPVELSSGRAHFTEILGFMRSEDGLSGQKGPLFRVPVVVHKPEPLVDGLMINPLREVLFAPGSVVRRFYEAPVGATYALLRIVTGSATFLGVGNDRTGSMDGYAEFSDVSGRPRQTSEYGTVTSMKSRTADASFRDAYHVSSNVKMTKSAKAEDAPSDNRAYSDNLTTKSSVVLGSADARNFVAHIVQISPRKHCAELETRQNFTLRPGTVKESIVQVQGGSVLELCLAQVWSSPGLSLIDRVELVFGGVVPNPNVVHASAGASCFPRVEAVRYLPFLSSLDNCPTLISGYTPRGSLTHIQRVYAPSKGKIRTLGGRDVLPEVGVISQLQLEYKFEVFDSSSSVKLIFPGLNRTVYESEIDGGPFVLVHDKNNQFLFASDIYPQTRTLTKGEYSVTAYLRHDRVDLLEGLREQKLTVEFKLSSEIVLEAFESAHAASMGIEGRRSSRSTASLECGERRAFYFGLPKKSALPKWIAGGDSAVGKMSVDKLLNGSGNSVRKGSDIPSYKLSLAIGPNAGSSQKSDSARTPLRSSENDEATEMDKNSEKLEDEDKREEPDRNDEDKVVDSEKSEPNGTIKGDPFQWFEEAVRKLKVKRLRSLLKRRKISEFEILYQSMEEKYPRDIELVLLGLEKLDVQGCSESRKNKGSDAHKEILKDLASEAHKVISRMDACGIATHFGMMIDPESKEEACQRKKFEKKKGQLVEALFRKARALCELSNSDVSADMASTGIGSSTEKDEYKGDESVAKAAPDDFENAIKQLCRWVTLDGKGSIPGSSRSATLRDGSVTNEDLLLLAAKREVRRKRCGVALKLMDTFYGALPSKTIESKEMSVFKETLLQTLEWEHLKEAEFCTRVMKFPNHRAPY